MSTTDRADASTTDAVGVLAGNTSCTDLLLHGEPLAAHARRALHEAGLDVVPVDEARRRSGAVVVHDARCPLTPAAFVSSLVDEARASGVVQVGCRPVTDTIKAMAEGTVGATVDRDALVTVTAPVVLPAAVVAALDDWPGPDDPAVLVSWLRERFEVAFVEAPALGRRVEDASAVLVLEAFVALRAG